MRIPTTPNDAVILDQPTIEVVISGKATQFPAKAILYLLPNPRLVIDFEGPFSGFAKLDQMGPSIRLLRHGINVPVIPTSLTFQNFQWVKGSLAPRREPLTVLTTKRQLRSIQFSVFNFPDVYSEDTPGSGDEKRQKQYFHGIRLNAADWQIEITPAQPLQPVMEALKKSGGYAITHIGIARKTSGSFTVRQVEHLLECLRLFLSFARGAFTSPTIECGFDRHQAVVWQRWGAHMVAPWAFAPSCFDTMHGEILSQVFPGFWALFNDPKWSNTLRTALYWYLRSNRHGQGAGIDGGLILSQSALELISHVYLGRPRGHTPASAAIRHTLTSMRINTTIPRSCRHIRASAKSNGWSDAPHALVEIRNELVHPRSKYGGAISNSYYEAWNLSQRYIELMLLRLFKHRGLHANRLTQQYRGKVVRVPWA